MRADLYLFTNGFVKSRQRARDLILDGDVTVDGKTLSKPAQDIIEGEHTVEVRDPLIYVGRGGWKLEAALNSFQIDVAGYTALDIGASTGGFTDCLLQRGAKKVVAVDSGEGQLASKLQEDPRVVSFERTNARNLTANVIGSQVNIIVMDVSFISATLILPRFPDLLAEGGEAVCLIKPQFELGKSALGKNGIVKDPKLRLLAVKKVLQAGESVGLVPVGLIQSPVTGKDGNIEYLVWFRKDSAVLKLSDEQISAILAGERK